VLVTAAGLKAYLIDHGLVFSIEGVSIGAVIREQDKSRTIAFALDGNIFVARLAAPLAKGAIVVITGKGDHGDVVSARYVIE
jgi:hypothetical protein